MTISDRSVSLIELLPQVDLSGLGDLSVRGLVQDSRKVSPGDLFVARKGLASDGRAFISQAISQGAVAVLMQGSEPEVHAKQLAHPDTPILRWDESQFSLGHLADRFYDSPSSTMTVVGITGTNGKTSSAHFMVQALNHLGIKTALIGTLGNGFLTNLDSASHTTPDAVSLHKQLAEYKALGAKAVVMEVSSHAIDQGRIDGVHFNLVAYTNLSRDHLDYHETMENYAAAKARLFTDYGVELQLLNLDDPYAAAIANMPLDRGTRVAYSSRQSAYVQLADLKQHSAGMDLKFKISGEEISLSLPLLGRFNVENLMLVAGALSLLGQSAEQVCNAMSVLKPVTGRMQLLAAENSPTVIVDYAHTPDALEKALQACREHLSNGHLQLIFGCGGDRDRGKRPLMAEAGEAQANKLWVTSDNPRGEDPRAIIDDILAGIKQPEHVVVEVDRRIAIEQCVKSAQSTDLILLAGKGHEDYQEIQGQRYPFSDIEIARGALESRRVA